VFLSNTSPEVIKKLAQAFLFKVPISFCLPIKDAGSVVKASRALVLSKPY